MKKQAPAFQAYAHELLALYTGLGLEAIGATHRLFLVMWGQSGDQSSFVDDDPMLARTVGIPIEDWKHLRAEIQHPARPIFEEKNERLISPYLKREALKQRKYRELQAEKSKKGVEARVTRGLPAGMPRVTSSSSSSSSISTSPLNKKKTTEEPPAVNREFEELWTLYPTRNGKKLERQAALKKFGLLTAEDRHLVLVAVKNYAASGEMPKDPHRWLSTAKGDEPWRSWITPSETPKEKPNGKGKLCHSGFADKDYNAGTF